MSNYILQLQNNNFHLLATILAKGGFVVPQSIDSKIGQHNTLLAAAIASNVQSCAKVEKLRLELMLFFSNYIHYHD